MRADANTVLPLNVDIPVNAALRRLGYPPNVDAVTGTAREYWNDTMALASSIMHPRGIWRPVEIEENDGRVVTLVDWKFQIESAQVARLLDNCSFAVFFMVTLGPAVDQRIQQAMDSGEMTRSFMLDAVASETADAAADRLHRQLIRSFALSRSLDVTPRFSPGYGDWPLTVQKEILNFCGGHRLGISVSDSFLMSPRKSVSAVLGWKPVNTTRE